MTNDLDASAADQLSAASFLLGCVSFLTCWWFPYGAAVGCAGAAFGILAMLWPKGRAVYGFLFSASGAGAGFLLAWDYWFRILAR